MSQFFKSSFTSKKQFGMLSIGMDLRNVERKQKEEGKYRKSQGDKEDILLTAFLTGRSKC